MYFFIPCKCLEFDEQFRARTESTYMGQFSSPKVSGFLNSGKDADSELNF